ncbi:hypothetical protein COT49_00270 [candidate division WWE3 bacterium CG08_land_8_20_14_0_20_40_13]|uniref:Uncharacterized protein n=1 Tax=candidate division WWE3 bacterium CG08_land_8_20_14_0_20_40_13 TaxID=1975084 RepID=A0A2H0XF00_UNCKA|nr:MAG: hypothetical protein COT49_00270 [candidate division WWE3 bacterium CG08_land_8_20_14_0_20_40_13]
MNKSLLPKLKEVKESGDLKEMEGILKEFFGLPLSELAVAEAFRQLSKNSIWKLLQKKEQ